ncbi:hypothetical protein LCGC14_2062610, partial [marine sediment metagenome]
MKKKEKWIIILVLIVGSFGMGTFVMSTFNVQPLTITDVSTPTLATTVPAPTLDPIIPNPNIDGIVIVRWTRTVQFDMFRNGYEVYRSTNNGA